jgi:hypothetical protein
MTRIIALIAGLALAAVMLTLGGSSAYAHAVPAPIGFKCFQLAEKGGALNTDITLTDQFGTEAVKVVNPHFLCTPVEEKCVVQPDGKKQCEQFDVTDDGSPDHLLCWKIAPSGPPVSEEVTARGSEFEDRTVTVQTGQLFCEFVRKEIRKRN